MASYTITVRQLKKAGFDIFGSYPCREGYKERLEEDIVNFYNDFEIGFATVGMFKDKLTARLNLIMPNYNKLYEAYETEFNLLYNVHMEEEFVQTNEGGGSGKSETQVESSNSTVTSTKNVNTNFPDSKLDGGDIDSMEYAESGTLVHDSVTDGGETNNTTTNSSDHSETTSYKRVQDGSSAGMPFSKAFRQFREDYIYNINQQIIHDISDLFIQIW